MPNWRRSSVSRGINLNMILQKHDTKNCHLVLTSWPITHTSFLMENIYLNYLMFELTLLSLRFHQRQLLEETRGGCPSPPRPTQLDVERHSPLHAVPQGGAREAKKVSAPAPAASPSVREMGKKAALSLYGAIPVDIMGSSLLFLFTSGCVAFFFIILTV